MKNRNFVYATLTVSKIFNYYLRIIKKETDFT